MRILGLVLLIFTIVSGQIRLAPQQEVLRADGTIQSPVDWSHLTSGRQSRALFPSSFDSRDSGWITAAKDQGSCGGCWSFSTLGALEAQILKYEEVAINFSEYHMLQSLNYDFDQCLGGTNEMAIAYLTNGIGPVLEHKYDAYPFSDSVQLPSSAITQRYVETMLHYPPRIHSNDNSHLKAGLLEHGALFINFYADSVKYYDAASNSYYCDSVDVDLNSNHAVLLIGWDDNKVTKASNPGAFLIKNSYGAALGDNGSIWIAYEDVKLGYEINAAFTDLVEATNYSNLYYHDTLGHTSQLGLVAGVDSAWSAAVFTTTVADSIGAVGTYLLQAGSSYEITLFGTYEPSGDNATFSTPLATASGTKAEAGYYTIPLSDTVALGPGETFAVVIKYKTPGYEKPLPIEHAIDGYSSQAVAAAGETYYSGSGVTFVDLTTVVPTGSFCIKALGVSTANVDVQLLTHDTVTVNEASSVSLTNNHLYAVGPEEPASEIVYTVTTAPTKGHLENSDTPAVPITSFTQQDINDNMVLYVDDSAQLTMDSLIFSVSDGVGAPVIETLYLIVNPNNGAPVFTHDRDTLRAFEGDEVVETFPATDSDSEDVLIYSVAGPVGMIIDSLGSLHWQTEASDAGEYAIIVTVNDDSGAVDWDSVIVIIDPPTAITLEENSLQSKTCLVYPNPVSRADQFVNIVLPEDFSGEVICIIYDVVGKRVDYQELVVNLKSSLRWDLRNDQGKRVGSGSYLAMLQMTYPNGRVKGETLVFGVRE